MVWNVEMVNTVIGKYRIWKINDTEIKLRLPGSKCEILKKSLEKLEYNLSNDLPINDVSNDIDVCNVFKILYKFFLADFLDYAERYFGWNYENSRHVTLEEFILERVANCKQPLVQLSKTEVETLRDSIILRITSGGIKELDIQQHLLGGFSLAHIGTVIGESNFANILINFYEDELDEYIDMLYQAAIYNRELPTYSEIMTKYLNSRLLNKDENTLKIKESVLKKQEEYASRLIEENIKTMKLDKDVWVLYYKHDNLRIASVTIDFSPILSYKFEIDFKKYYKHELSEAIISKQRIESVVNQLNTCMKLVNFIYEDYGVECFGQLTATDVNMMVYHLKNNMKDERKGTDFKPATISKVMGRFRKQVDYLIEYEVSTINHPVPVNNFFRQVNIKNKDKMSDRTDVIPEHVVKQLHKYKGELNPIFENMYDIFEGTGMRLKEVAFLEEDCLEPTDDGIILRYTPYKVLLSRRKASREDKEFNYITEELNEIIKERIKSSAELRKKHNSPYIFIDDDGGKLRIKGEGFTTAINRLIEIHQIRDINNELWRFSSRQMRKTVAATMIQNGATETEVMQQLKHVRLHTTRTYYEDVEKLKIADMNEEFFKKKFELKVGKEQLSLYSEEERRALYVDFALNERDVEFGKCIKHISEGPCGKRSGRLSCANCPKICTGKQYLDKWKTLFLNQEKIVQELELTYLNEGIPSEEYTQFIEYKREIKQLKLYEETINKITGE